MSDDLIRQAREMLKWVSAGPWKYSPSHFEEGPAAVRSLEGWYICTTSSDADSEFISWCREGVPALIAELERMKEEADDAINERAGTVHRLYGEIAALRSELENRRG